MDNTNTENQTTEEDDSYDSSLPSDLQKKLDDWRRQELRQAQIGEVVFSLRKSQPVICAAKDTALVDMLEENARALNAAFRYYFDNASKAPDSDRKIGLALRSHAQMVSAIHMWQRLNTSKNEGTN